MKELNISNVRGLGTKLVTIRYRPANISDNILSYESL